MKGASLTHVSAQSSLDKSSQFMSKEMSSSNTHGITWLLHITQFFLLPIEIEPSARENNLNCDEEENVQ